MSRGCRYFKVDEITGFICGGEPTDHKCNEDANILILKDGNRIENTPDNYEKHLKDIIGGSVACSICGRAAIDDMSKMEF